MQEREEMKTQFSPLIEQLGRVSALIDAEELSALLAPSDLFTSASNMQKLRNYLRGYPDVMNMSKLQEELTCPQ